MPSLTNLGGTYGIVLPGLAGPPNLQLLSGGFGGPGKAVSSQLVIRNSQVFFVNSAHPLAADAGNQGMTPDRPFKTLNFALGRTLNNNGDVIYCGPQHVETVASAAALTFPTATAAGVTVYFMGNETDRASINFTTLTTASVTMPASGVTLVCPLFTNAIDALATGVSITGSDCKIIGGEWRDGVALNTLIGIITTNAAKRLSILGYRYYEDKTGGGTQKTEHIRIVGGDHHRFADAHVTGDFTTGCLNNVTTASTEVLLERCSFNNLNSTPHVAIACTTSTTGVAFQCVLVVASGTTGITASNKISFDKTSSMAGPGIVQPATS